MHELIKNSTEIETVALSDMKHKKNKVVVDITQKNKN